MELDDFNSKQETLKEILDSATPNEFNRYWEIFLETKQHNEKIAQLVPEAINSPRLQNFLELLDILGLKLAYQMLCDKLDGILDDKSIAFSILEQKRTCVYCDNIKEIDDHEPCPCCVENFFYFQENRILRYKSLIKASGEILQEILQ